MRLILISFFFCICLTSCFRRFVMTEKQLNAYYSNKPARPTYFTIQNDSVTLFCATMGADTLPPLLIIHGAPGAWYGSRNIMDDTSLNRRFQIISVDRPGYDKSTFKGKRKAVTSIGTQAIVIHEALRLNRSHRKGIIVGSSYGGPIAIKMAIDNPGEFYHIVLLAAAIDPDKEKFWWFHKYIRKGPVKWLLPRFMRNATDEKFAHTGELRKLIAEWNKLSVPVTVIQGDADHIVDPANLTFAKKLLERKQAQFIFLHGVDHLIRWQRPEIVRSVLLGPPPGASVEKVITK